MAILNYEPLAQVEVRAFLLKQRLIDEGHSAFFAPQSQMELQFNVDRIARLAKTTPADAWIVMSGSKDVLAWFVEQEVPVSHVSNTGSTL